MSACGGDIREKSANYKPLAGAPLSSASTASSNFNGPRNAYNIEANQQAYIITEIASGNKSTIPANITTLQFSDMSVNLLVANKAQLLNLNVLNQLIELYVAFFNRTPDADGLAYWIDQIVAGQNMETVANSFYAAAIYYSAQTGYSSTMSNADFVRIIYQNVLARTGPTAPGDDEVNYWAGQLDSGKMSRGGLVISMLTSAHTYEGDADYGWVPQLLNNKITVANYFCLQQGLNYLSGEDSIIKGMAIAKAVTITDTSAAIKMIGVNDANFNLVNSAPDKVSIVKLKSVPNNTAIQLGFWEVFAKQDVTLASMGKRPTSRVGFDAWSAIETKKGVYDFSNFDSSSGALYQRVHNYGESIYGAINIAFSSQITPGKTTIPSFYTSAITDPTTRQAAKNFLTAYVQHMLRLVGSLTLTIDYEIVSNYRLSVTGSEGRAAEWADWYVEAAATARKAAADIGKANQLKLQPIVNGNPLDPSNPINKGRDYNNWLVRVVAASDSLALDTYHSDPALANTDPKRTFDIIQFWIDQFSNGKDVIVTENGFNTVTQIIPTITRADRDWKTTGTEQDQATYFSSLFAQLANANKKDGIFHNQLKSFNIWSIIDNDKKAANDEDRYFGLLRLDGSEKPAAPVVRDAINSYEADPFTRPDNITGLGLDVTANLNKSPSTPVNLSYTEGNQFEFLRYSENNLPAANKYNLEVNLSSAANVIICVNGSKWQYQEAQNNFVFDVTPFVKAGTPNRIDIYITSSVFPANVLVKAVQLRRL
jgi:hypothetical protein